MGASQRRRRVLALAVFYWLIDVRRYRRWCLPLAGIGRKTLVLYSAFGAVECLKLLVPQAVWRSFAVFRHSPPHSMEVYGPLVLTAALPLLLWRMGGRISSQQQGIGEAIKKS